MNNDRLKWLQLLIVLTAPLLSVIDIFIINVAIPSIKTGLHATDAAVQLMVAGYLLGYASFQISSGRAGDHFGRKKVFLLGMIFFTLTSCLCGLAATPMQLNIARFFQGVSAALMLPQTIAYIQVIFPEPKERTAAVGIYGITLGVAAILGQFLGGFLSGIHGVIEGWRLVFFINLPVGLAAIWATSRYLKETPKNTGGTFDFAGVAIITAGLGCLIFPLIQGREQGWPLWSILLLLLSIPIFGGFIRNQNRKEARGRSPLVNMSLFRIRDFNIGLLAVLFYFMMHTSYLLLCTVYMQSGLGISPLQSGMYFVLFGLLFTCASLLSIRLVHRFGKRVLQIGVMIIITAFVLQAMLFTAPVNALHFYLLMALAGLGSGLVLPSLMNMALKSIPGHFAGAAAGVYSTFQQVASSLGIGVIGGIFYALLHPLNGIENYGKAFHYGMIAEIVCLVITGALLYVMPDSKASAASAVLVVD